MGTISRESSAPIADGEVASGAELELEFDKLFDEINGNLDDDNIKTGADINGAKLANTSIPGSKLADAGITLAKIATGHAVTVEGFDNTSNAAAAALTADDAWHTVDEITISDQTATDEFIAFAYMSIESASDAAGAWEFSFELDDVQQSAMAQVAFTAATAQESTVCWFWKFTPGTTSNYDVKSAYQRSRGTSTAQFGPATYTSALLVLKIPT